MNKIAVVFTDLNGNALDTLNAQFKTFKTGSVGFYAGGKIMLGNDGKRYQVSCSIVEVGSKPQE